MPNATRGEVWLTDMGLAAKVRPALVFNVSFRDEERAVYAIIPHTTAVRGGRFEVSVLVPWLAQGAFDVQGLRSIPGAVLLRRLGMLNPAQLEGIELAVKVWLGLR